MVGTIKRAIGRVIVDTGREWDKVVGRVVFGYQKRPLKSGISPFELFCGVKPRLFQKITHSNASSLTIYYKLDLLGSLPLKRRAPKIT